SWMLTLGFKTQTGSRVWSTRYAGKGANNAAFEVALSTDGSTAYVTSQTKPRKRDLATTVAYDVAAGGQLWASTDPVGAKESSSGFRLAVAGADGSRLAVVGQAHTGSKPSHARTIEYDAATGAIVWRTDYVVQGDSDGFGDDVTASPAGSAVFSLIGRC